MKHKKPLSHNLNITNIHKLIDASNVDVREIVKTIINNTKHISYETFIQVLNNNINAVIADGYIKHNTMYVYIPNIFDENRSNFWLYYYFEQYMKMQYDINVRLIDHFSQIINLDNETVFIIDDCVYSGTQIAKDYFDTTEYDEWQQINSMQNEDDDTIFNEIKVYFLISYVSNLGKTNIINAYENHPLFNQYEYVWPEHVEIIEPVTNYISYEELIQLYRYYDPKVEIINLYPIYFDHKLASSSSTLTELYLGIVPNSNNLEVIKNYNETGNSFLLQKLIIYPIISNCDKIKINDLQNELKSPSCPFSPYKEEGIKYIENNVIFSNPKKRQHSVVSPVKSSTKLQKI